MWLAGVGLAELWFGWCGLRLVDDCVFWICVCVVGGLIDLWVLVG